MQSLVVGDKRRQVGDTCKIMQAEHPEPSGGRQAETSMGDKWKIMGQSIQSLVGDKWETGGDKRRQVGDTCEITRKKLHKCRIMRAEHPRPSGRQVGDKRDKWETM